MKVLEYKNKNTNANSPYIIIEYENIIYWCFFNPDSLKMHRFTHIKKKYFYGYDDLIGEHPQLIAELVDFTIQYIKLASICD